MLVDGEQNDKDQSLEQFPLRWPFQGMEGLLEC
jgi:hypothetical protein